MVRQCWWYISATLLSSADLPALDWSKRRRPEPLRRACLLRYEQKSVVAACTCSAASEVHSSVLLFAHSLVQAVVDSAVDASPGCPWERFPSFDASQCSDLICPARFTLRCFVHKSYRSPARRTPCKQLLYAICVPKHRPTVANPLLPS